MSACDLLVVITTIPFAIRSSENRTEWSTEAVAWYYAHLELYLTNTFAGGNVFLTVAITTERYLAFCHPFKARSLHLTSPHRSHILALIIPIATAILYIPYMLRCTVETVTKTNPDNTTTTVYKVEENYNVTTTIYYIIYDYSKEIVFRIAPAIILVTMNICIILRYNKANTYLKRRRFMRIRISPNEIIELKESKRLMLILGGLSVQFVICTAPAAVLAIMIDSQEESCNFSFAVFRAVANLLEVTKNASTFFVYCLCSGEYRQRFIKYITRHSNKIHNEHKP